MKKTKNKKYGRKKEKHYSVGYLALIVLAFLVLEVLAFGSASITDWQVGSEILDASGYFGETIEQFEVVFEPPSIALSEISEFYRSATDEAVILLDASEYNNLNPLVIVHGVIEFYKLASTEMVDLLDLTSVSQSYAHVAGAIISK